MAIIKVVKRSGKTHTALKRVLNYVGKKAYLTRGINCDDNYKNVAYNFFETKDYYKKTDGRQYRHYIQSFRPGEITEDKIMEVATEWAKKAFPDHEVFIAVHNDREHLHAHFIVNTVNFRTGKKLHEKQSDLEEKKSLNDEVCLEHGIDNTIQPKKDGEVIAYSKEKYQIIKKGADITRLAETILKQIKTATSKMSFILGMKDNGYETEWKDNKKHVVFTVSPDILKGKKNKFRLSNLQKTFSIPDFDKDRLLSIFNNNLEKTQEKKLRVIADNMNFDKLEKQKQEEIKKSKKIPVKIVKKEQQCSWKKKKEQRYIDFK